MNTVKWATHASLVFLSNSPFHAKSRRTLLLSSRTVCGAVLTCPNHGHYFPQEKLRSHEGHVLLGGSCCLVRHLNHFVHTWLGICGCSGQADVPQDTGPLWRFATQVFTGWRY
jgi:hypothetical protein